MKLQSHISRKRKDKSYEKFWIILPKKIIEELGWERGDNLKCEKDKKELIVSKA